MTKLRRGSWADDFTVLEPRRSAMLDHKFCPECGYKLVNIFQLILLTFIVEMCIALWIFR